MLNNRKWSIVVWSHPNVYTSHNYRIDTCSVYKKERERWFLCADELLYSEELWGLYVPWQLVLVVSLEAWRSCFVTYFLCSCMTSQHDAVRKPIKKPLLREANHYGLFEKWSCTKKLWPSNQWLLNFYWCIVNDAIASDSIYVYFLCIWWLVIHPS